VSEARPWVGLLAVVVCASGCTPPEAQRVQGGDAGADIGNRSPVVEMHAGSVIYPAERCAVRGEECTGPMPASGREPATSPLVHDPHVLGHMGRGGAVRRVVYEPPPELARPTPREVEPAQPGPGTGRGDHEEPGVPADPAEDAPPDQ
jgi:hypothetical protein